MPPIRLVGRSSADGSGRIDRIEAGRYVVFIREIARRRIEPRTVLLDGSANRAVDVIELLQLGRGRGSRSFSRWVRLLPCKSGVVPLISAVPEKRLPPALGIAFMITPLVPVSAD